MIACLASNRSRAQAHERACSAAQLQVEGEIGARWAEAVGRVCGELGVREDLDRTAVLRLRAVEHDQLHLEVVLSDGRTAQRVVHAPEELPLAVEALLALPAAAEPPPTAALPPATQPEAAVTAPNPSSSLGVEISAELMVRVARAPTYFSPGLALYLGMLPGDWWLGLNLRWEPGQELVSGEGPPDFEMDSVAVGFIAARSVLTGDVGLRLGMSVLVVDVIQSSRPVDVEETHSTADIRFGVVGRLAWGKLPWRLAISLDLDVSPLRVSREQHLVPELPALPVWSAGVGVGMAWEER